MRVELTLKSKAALENQIRRLDGVQRLFDKRYFCFAHL